MTMMMMTMMTMTMMMMTMMMMFDLLDSCCVIIYLTKNCIILQAALGIGTLIVDTLVSKGMPEDDAIKHVWFFDSKGLLVKV